MRVWVEEERKSEGHMTIKDGTDLARTIKEENLRP